MDFLSPEKLQVFVVVILPGFVAIKVFDVVSPPEKRDFGASVIEAVAYGLVNFAFWAWNLVELTPEGAKNSPVLYSFMFFIICVVSPGLIAVSVCWIRKRKWVCKQLGETTKSAWDDFFNKRKECFVLCHLKSGKKVAGWFGPSSFATVYPQKPEIYLEITYYVDQESGKMHEGGVPQSFGAIVRFDDCTLVEFFHVERPNA